MDAVSIRFYITCELGGSLSHPSPGSSDPHTHFMYPTHGTPKETTQIGIISKAPQTIFESENKDMHRYGIEPMTGPADDALCKVSCADVASGLNKCPQPTFGPCIYKYFCYGIWRQARIQAYLEV